MARLAYIDDTNWMEKGKLLQALSHNIRASRKNIGMSQEEFADRVGMERSYYGRIERGQVNISVLQLYRIYVALNMLSSTTLEDLFNDLKGTGLGKG